jgi:hypothetical protein
VPLVNDWRMSWPFQQERIRCLIAILSRIMDRFACAVPPFMASDPQGYHMTEDLLEHLKSTDVAMLTTLVCQDQRSPDVVILD